MVTGTLASVDNDPSGSHAVQPKPACRPSVMKSLLGDISEALVDFIDNFDSSQQEPMVLSGPVAQPTAERVFGHCGGHGHQHSFPTTMAEVNRRADCTD